MRPWRNRLPSIGSFGKEQSKVQVEPPPHSVMRDDVSTQVFSLFEAAFSPSAVNAGRPSPKQWMDALAFLEKGLTRCQLNPGHYRFRDQKCPWCRIHMDGGPNFFTSSVTVTTGSSTDFDLRRLGRTSGQFLDLPIHKHSIRVSSSFRWLLPRPLGNSPERLLAYVFIAITPLCPHPSRLQPCLFSNHSFRFSHVSLCYRLALQRLLHTQTQPTARCVHFV